METSERNNSVKHSMDAAAKYGIAAITQTKIITTKILDTADTVDRKLYGKKLKIFIWGALTVLMIAPLFDELLSIPNDRLTFYSTFVYLTFLIAVGLAWISAWRDDNGNWTFARAISRFKTYYESANDTFKAARVNTQESNFYNVSVGLIVGGICWKALQNVSVFIRKPMETLFSTRFQTLRDFEKFTNHAYIFVVALGIVGLIYLWKKNPKIIDQLLTQLKRAFGFGEKPTTSVVVITETTETVLNAKNDSHMQHLVTSNESKVFKEFVIAVQNWTPKNCYYEYEYQDKLYRHLRKALPNVKIDLEFPIGQKSLGNKGRADIVVNESILIEMKRDSSAGAIQRAKGQIMQYSEIWKERGPSVLLLCNYDYEHAKLSFTPTMKDLMNLKRPVITVVAANLN